MTELPPIAAASLAVKEGAEAAASHLMLHGRATLLVSEHDKIVRLVVRGLRALQRRGCVWGRR